MARSGFHSGFKPTSLIGGRLGGGRFRARTTAGMYININNCTGAAGATSGPEQLAQMVVGAPGRIARDCAQDLVTESLVELWRLEIERV